MRIDELGDATWERKELKRFLRDFLKGKRICS